MKKIITIALLLLVTLTSVEGKKKFGYRAWLAGKYDMPEELLEKYFQKAADCGIEAILLECHGGYPDILQDSTSFRDSAALVTLRRAAVYAKKYNIELHAWMWTTNRCEKNLRDQHPDWYQVNGEGHSVTEVKLYGREHYRFLCPSHQESVEYMKERVRELAEVDGLAGIHMDFIRYPDAILPYGLHASRGVVQDKVYPFWDCCYCDECRALFKARTGRDPLELEDPNADKEWLEFRWEQMAKFASAIAAEIKACGKESSAAVFASPEESRKLVRQDWTSFTDTDCMYPMIYHSSYAKTAQWVETAAREGVKELKAKARKGYYGKGKKAPELYAGVIGPYRNGGTADLIKFAQKSGADGICFFCLESFERSNSWDDLKKAIAESK